VVVGWIPGLSTKNRLFEEPPVQLDEVFPLLWRLVLDENGLHRADRLTGPAVDTLIRMDEELVRALVDTIDWADLDTGLVLQVDTRLDDDICHGAFSP
jgi:hypothetical protein